MSKFFLFKESFYTEKRLGWLDTLIGWLQKIVTWFYSNVILVDYFKSSFSCTLGFCDIEPLNYETLFYNVEGNRICGTKKVGWDKHWTVQRNLEITYITINAAIRPIVKYREVLTSEWYYWHRYFRCCRHATKTKKRK